MYSCSMNMPVKTSIFMVILFLVLAVVAMTYRNDPAMATHAKAHPRIILLASGWTAPCKTAMQLQRDLASEYKDRVDAESFIASRAPEEVKKYAVRVLPTLIIEDAQGHEITRYEGIVPREQVVSQLNVLLK